MWTCTGIRGLVYVVVQAQRQGAERAEARAELLVELAQQVPPAFERARGGWACAVSGRVRRWREGERRCICRCGA